MINYMCTHVYIISNLLFKVKQQSFFSITLHVYASCSSRTFSILITTRITCTLLSSRNCFLMLNLSYSFDTSGCRHNNSYTILKEPNMPSSFSLLHFFAASMNGTRLFFSSSNVKAFSLAITMECKYSQSIPIWILSSLSAVGGRRSMHYCKCQRVITGCCSSNSNPSGILLSLMRIILLLKPSKVTLFCCKSCNDV